MKLELKHLAPYLPYGLNMLYDFENGDVWKLDTTNINAITEYDKPILRPLSDLNKKEFKHIGNKLFNRDLIYKSFTEDLFIIKDFILNDIQYDLLIYLLKNHFDIFGLIEQGLAIDINTLKNK